MHFKGSLIVMITIAILFGSLVTTAGFPTMTRVLAYESSQAGSGANDCGNGENPFNILCQNLLSQIEGDGNAVIIMGSQTGGERTPEPPTTGILRVIKEVVCPAGISDCPSPEGFEIKVTGNSPNPPSFQGSLTGVDVSIGPGSYSVEEPTITELPEDTINKVSLSEECSGTISIGDTKTCTITNTITPVGTLTVITTVGCVPGRLCPPLPPPSAFIIQVLQNGQIIEEFPSSTDGTTVFFEPGEYEMREFVPAFPPGTNFLSVTFSTECFSESSEPILAGEERTCIITNEYGPIQ